MSLVEVADTREERAPGRAPVRWAVVQRPWELLLAGWCWTVLLAVTLYQYGKGRLLARRRGAQIWGPVLRDWARQFIRLSGCRVRAEGWPEIAGAAVLVANHRSVFDIPVLASLVPPPVVFVARRDLFEVPIVGGVLSRGGHVPVDRGGGEDSRLVLERSLDHLRGGGKVVFFAEGTRSESGAVRPLHAGAFLAALRAGCPLVPVALAGTGRIVPKGRRVMRPGAVAVSFLPSLAVDEESARPAGRRRVRDRLAVEVRRLERTAVPGARRPVP